MTSNKRIAPTVSATLFKKGTVKKGNDGKKWMIVTNKHGVKRWQKMNTSVSSKTRRTMKRNNTSARVVAMKADPDSVWGKNKPLERFWNELASGRKVVLIKKNGDYEMYTMPKATHDYLSEDHAKQYDTFEKDPDIIAILTSYRSQDAYELHLYPKAKDATVEYVIKHYQQFFHTKIKKTYMP